MQQYRINTCVPESRGVESVTAANGQLKITLENGQEFTVPFPTEDKHITGASVAGDTLTLKVAGGSDVVVNLATLLQPLRNNAVTNIAVRNGNIELTKPDGSKLTAALPADEKGVVSGALSGSNLLLKDAEGATVSTVNLSSLIPAAKADRFLSSVVHREADKKLVFTTSAQGEANQTFEVAVEDFLRVVTGDALTGDGTTARPLSVRAASTTAAGVVEFATTAEARTGTASNLAVTPAGMKAALDAAAPTTASAQTAGVVKLGDRVLANDGKTVLGYLVNV